MVTTSKIICEYAGGANLVTTEDATANATNYLSGHNYGYGVVIDNYWNILDASEGIHIGKYIVWSDLHKYTFKNTTKYNIFLHSNF